jgi:ABC-type hemin transport system ATPase subunit
MLSGIFFLVCFEREPAMTSKSNESLAQVYEQGLGQLGCSPQYQTNQIARHKISSSSSAALAKRSDLELHGLSQQRVQIEH